MIPLDSVHHNVLYTVGFTFSFGGAKPAVAAAPAPAPAPAPVVPDSDKDGVPDNVDKCPDTPSGCPVDKDGCPLDSDSDGVIDCKDKCPGTPIGVRVDEEGCPLKEKKPEIIEKGRTTLNVLFDFDKAVIKDNYSKDIEDLADLMKKYPDQLKNITIEGHTDSVGSAEYNKKLSQRRADAVKAYLIEKGGIDPTRINAIGYGEERPVASNATKEGRQKNRRVEAESVEYIIKK
ncbi:MAG: OmpA family protein [Syntrophales bacterium]|nr:OmpA family protein [Syntrophales bacterium]